MVFSMEHIYICRNVRSSKIEWSGRGSGSVENEGRVGNTGKISAYIYCVVVVRIHTPYGIPIIFMRFSAVRRMLGLAYYIIMIVHVLRTKFDITVYFGNRIRN